MPDPPYDQCLKRILLQRSLMTNLSAPSLGLFSRASFLRGAVHVQGFPETDLPEIAFIGRSNVGKSSLINGLLNRKSLAQTSKKPGKTAQINFFNISDTFLVVDMPGYGYAAVSHKTKQLWHDLIPSYFQERRQWLHTFLLVDGRHPPQKTDWAILDFLKNYGTPFTLVLTKVDKVSLCLLEERRLALRALKNKNMQDILAFSVQKEDLKHALRHHVLKILGLGEHD